MKSQNCSLEFTKINKAVYSLCTNMYDRDLREGAHRARIVESKVVVRDGKHEKRVKASRFNFHREIVESRRDRSLGSSHFGEPVLHMHFAVSTRSTARICVKLPATQATER